MREIKFRIWDEGLKEMLYFGLWNIDYNVDISMYNENDIMQYTGLKDKNGKEIYEGDIVKAWWDKPFITSLEQDFETGEIFYNKVMQGYSLRIKEEDEDLTPMMNCFDKFEILGNKYENPELLKEG